MRSNFAAVLYILSLNIGRALSLLRKRKVRTAKGSVLPNRKALHAGTASATESRPPSGKGERVE